MKFNIDVIQYLTDQKFSNGLIISISVKEENITSRFKSLEKLVKSKNVIHVGCCDHIPLIEKKLSKNSWLHKRIVESANKCIGIDIDNEGISYLKENLHYEDVYCSDITKHILPEIANRSGII